MVGRSGETARRGGGGNRSRSFDRRNRRIDIRGICRCVILLRALEGLRRRRALIDTVRSQIRLQFDGVAGFFFFLIIFLVQIN